MGMHIKAYAEVRALMKPGDVIAFGGKGHFSQLIKFATRSTVSHVGIILHTKVVEDPTDRYFNQIIESTSDGVQIYRASERIARYEGEVWWLPRRSGLPFDMTAFYNFLFAKRGIEYDVAQAVMSAVDLLDHMDSGQRLSHNREDFDKFFCSELVAAALEVAGTVGRINASEVTPVDLCRWQIYESDYMLLTDGTGRPEITRYNSLDPRHWASGPSSHP